MSHIVSVVAQYIDTVAMLAQIMVLAIGYPMQIKSLVKSRSAQGASIWMWSSATLAHALWSTRAGIQGDMFLLLPNAAGLLLALIVVGLICKRRA